LIPKQARFATLATTKTLAVEVSKVQAQMDRFPLYNPTELQLG